LVGRTEREVALVIEDAMRRGGGEPAFPCIVAAGENGASPHATPRDVAIEAGQLVTIDYGARLDGYCSDCTRTFAARAISGALATLFALVLEAQAAGLAATVAGAEGAAVDAVARDLIAAGGHGEHFGHSLGHGVGMEVHEGPRLARTVKDTLEPGNAVTVEPGVYVPGLGGVRIEDLVVVTDGAPEVLTGVDKGLTTLD
jgi:Xaa-Pro aminopeptidase